MYNLQKSKQYDLKDMYNDISRLLDHIFTIDNPEFEKHIPHINKTELQMNKANTSDKETSFLDINLPTEQRNCEILKLLQVYKNDQKSKFMFTYV